MPLYGTERPTPEIPADWCRKNDPSAFFRCIDWDLLADQLADRSPVQRLEYFDEHVGVLGLILVRMFHICTSGDGEFNARTFNNEMTQQRGIVIIAMGTAAGPFEEVAKNLSDQEGVGRDGNEILDLTLIDNETEH